MSDDEDPGTNSGTEVTVDATTSAVDSTFYFHDDTFRPPSIDDRFEQRVRDDHAANQALHDALEASQDPTVDGSAKTVYNFMASHGPGEKDHEPRYHVTAEFRNEGMGHPTIEAPVRRLVDRGSVRIVDVLECGDDHLRVKLRPVERRVDPIEVPYGDLPDDVVEFSVLELNAGKILRHAIDEVGSNAKTYEAARALTVLLDTFDPDTDYRSNPAPSQGGDGAASTIKELSDTAGAEWEFEDDPERGEMVHFPDMGVPCATYECSDNATETQRYQFPSGYVVDLPLCGDHYDAFDPADVTSHPWQEDDLMQTIEFGDGNVLDVPVFESKHDATDAAAAIIREFGQGYHPGEVALKTVGALDGWHVDPTKTYNEAEGDGRMYVVELFNDAYKDERDRLRLYLPDVDHDVDDRFASIRATVGGDEYTSVVREKEKMPDLPPDVDVYVDRVEAVDGTLIPCGCGEYAVEVPERTLPDAIDVVCPECGNHFGHDDADDLPYAVPRAPIREWVEDRKEPLFEIPGKLTDDGVDFVVEGIARAIEDHASDADDFEAVAERVDGVVNDALRYGVAVRRKDVAKGLRQLARYIRDTNSSRDDAAQALEGYADAVEDPKSDIRTAHVAGLTIDDVDLKDVALVDDPFPGNEFEWVGKDTGDDVDDALDALRYELHKHGSYIQRKARSPDVTVAVQDKDDGSIVAKEDAKSGYWFEVDTGRGIYNLRVDVDAPDHDVAAALFETIAALADLRERIDAGHDPERVVRDVWNAYDLDEAEATFDRTDHPRAGDVDGFVFDEVVCTECGESHEDGACWDEDRGPYAPVNEARGTAIEEGYFEPECPECGYGPFDLHGSASAYRCPSCGDTGSTDNIDGWSAFDVLLVDEAADLWHDGAFDASVVADGVDRVVGYLESQGREWGEDRGAPYRRAARAVREWAVPDWAVEDATEFKRRASPPSPNAIEDCLGGDLTLAHVEALEQAGMHEVYLVDEARTIDVAEAFVDYHRLPDARGSDE